MERFIKRIIFFSLYFISFTAVINFIFWGVIAVTDWEYIKRRETMNFENPAFKLIVLGSSLAEYGIDTEYLTEQGIDSYNMALIGSSIKTGYIQLKEYLEKYDIKPEYVLLPVNAYLESFDQDGVHPMIEFTMKGQKYGIKDLPLSKFGWAGTELIKKLLDKTFRSTTLSHGHKVSIRIEPDESDYQELYLDIDKYRNAHWIAELAKLCNNLGIELFLIEIPGVCDSQNLSEVGPYDIHFSNGSYALLYNFNNQEFCSFIDPVNDWAGMSHFNKYGARSFTEQVLKILK